MKSERRHSQKLLWFFMAVVICGVVITGIMTNITLRSIERNLPNTLIKELNDLSFVLEDLADVVNAAEKAKIKPDAVNFRHLRSTVDRVYQDIVTLRETYVFDNLVKASAFHAVVAPAIADLQIWLVGGVSGFGPETATTAAIAYSRIEEAYQKARVLTRDSKISAQQILDAQRSRLDRFLLAVNLLFVLAIIVTLSIVYLLIRQVILQNREAVAQAELRNQRDLLNSLFDNVLLGITVWDRSGALLLSNRGFNQITGFFGREVQTLQDWFDKAFPDEDQRQSVASDWQKARTAGSAIHEFEMTCRDGGRKAVEFRIHFLPDGRALVTLLDITSRRQAEKVVRESQAIQARAKKMESLGLLAGGVAHDLNNILSGIVSYPELLLMELPPDSSLRKPIETMHESGQRAAAIVLDLLTVARGVATTKEPLDLNRLVYDYLRSPEFKRLREHHKGLTIETDLDPRLLNIYGSEVHIRKVLMNLVVNAAEAIKGEGSITLSTISRYVDKPFRGYDDCREGDYAVLSVTDTGSGISEDDRERIFEPFYTKKVMGRSGTGLGLAVVWNVVQDHRGYIDLKSRPQGTTFDLYFPVTRQHAADKADHLPMETYRGNGETILIVDDVQSQREIVEKVLIKLGYTPASVGSGEAAVAYAQQHEVDLIILDMIMDPGINGRETYERIIEIRPGQKAIIASGFAETEDVRAAQRLGAGRFIRKPFTIENLGLAIKAELEPAES